MKFEVLSDEQLNKPMYEPGIYWFIVKKVTEKISKAGNNMFQIEILVNFGNGMTLMLYDYLLCTKEASWKISQFCTSIGKEGLYKTGNMEPIDILEQRGKCELHYQINPRDEKKYLRVKSYLKTEENEKKEEFNDDIPF